MKKKIVGFAQREKSLQEQADVEPADLFFPVDFRNMGISHGLLY